MSGLKDPTGALWTVRFESEGSGNMSWYYTATYPTLGKANVGRIYAEALKNVPKLNKRSKGGWADLARAIGMENKRPATINRNRRCMSNGVSQIVWEHAMRGNHPKDEAQQAKLFELAGYPWSDE